MNIFKNNFILRTALFSTFILVFASCSSFLDVDPEGEVTPSDPDAKSAEASVIAVYNQALAWDVHSFSWIGVSSITSDDADKGSDPGDTGTDKHHLDDFMFNAETPAFNDIWVGNYQGISRANRAIEMCENASDIDLEYQENLIAEARFLRAYYYWNLVRCFGGVPKIDFVPDPADPNHVEIGRTRVTKEEIYELIKDDLAYAKEKLFTKGSIPSANLGRATKGAAVTFLAKVAMYEQDWAKVKQYTDEVMGMGYSLTNDYSHIWREIGQNNEESIFEFQARTTTPSIGIEGYSESQGVRNQFGWGFNTPSEDLVSTYEDGDLRVEGTIIFPGQTLWDGEVVNTDVPNKYYNMKAYFSRTQESYDGNNWESNKNLRIFRYGEVLLMSAEASYHAGGDVLTPINDLRKRAGLDPLPHSPTLEDIWKERRLEMAFEHDRFFDIVRQGRAAEVLRAVGKDNFRQGVHEIFPIPNEQIRLSGGVLTQNPGY
ncbi:RagB/SusD family nutrient uptake outer membrane protein [Aureibacter tunicatorum]|uniref:RagB/SusD family nutrient uptake outer membrane protein n=1 Tax=Aureibacter tunicatorum TaxID=866807 RepID=A0AAE4BV49_9BACT|nr:RagB/SusD family nutrient uptake outer membrane protein [Aureibacter tunicatorum]MDR6241423.1 hypothetical protein [Aureibacter tunicatorum]BDD06732.1 membrane protein [Aureibacter tunicatorum]